MQPVERKTTAVANQPRTSRTSLTLILALISSVLLDFCFPVAGPMPWWHALIAWFALVPLLYALLNESAASHSRSLRRGFFTGYVCGIVWYCLNCYWIYQTMLYYGHVPPLGSAGIVLLYSLVLGLYFGVFGLGLAYFRRRLGLAWALALAPFLWTALELAAARITSVPWDQLGYSQVDSLWITRLAPYTGVYGISFFLVLINALLLGCWITPARVRSRIAVGCALAGILLLLLLRNWSPAPAPTTTYAVLLQPNIDVATDDNWQGREWDGNPAWLLEQAHRTCSLAYNGLPPGSANAADPPQPRTCPENTPPPGIVLWPEVASSFQSDDPRTLALMHALATTAHASVVAGMFGRDPGATYNSALFVEPDGIPAGRYDKIHLVPFGEYIPYRDLFFFAHKLTHQLVDLQRGRTRSVFTTPDGHRYGIFICYEAVFADEVRLFARNGAQVLVNISDDGWYGDTSAPWQHLNMARMRAIENRRWILRDTNNGVTTAIDPYGRVTLSAPRHTITTLVARYGYRSDVTFYTQYGDVFAWLCMGVVLGALGIAFFRVSQSAS